MIADDNGGILITSNDATPTLRGNGTGTLLGTAYALPIYFASVQVILSATPQNQITPSTVAVYANGGITNFGIPGCYVTFRSVLSRFTTGAQ